MEQEVTKSKEERILNKAAHDVMRADLKSEEEKEKDDFAQMVDAHNNFEPPRQGDIIDTKVVQVSTDGLLLDMGTKSEGFMPWQEFSQKEGKRPQVGDEFKAYISGKDKNGHFLLSKKEAHLHLDWAKFEKAFEEGKSIKVKVEKVVKGGLLASLGVVQAFIPASHLSLQKEKDLKKFIGRNLSVRVIELQKRSNNVVISRKFSLLEEKEKRKEKTLAGLEEGKIVMGKVNSITKFGVFVDLGGIDGLIYPENLSWGWVNDPHEVISIGDKIKTRVLKLDREKKKISLGLRQTKPDPWTLVGEKYGVGSIVAGSNEFITNCRRYRKMLGGGMRQAGIIASFGLIALESKWINRLEEDHKNAKLLAEGIESYDLPIKVNKPDTNIVIIKLLKKSRIFKIITQLGKEGIKSFNISKEKIRFVTHYGIDEDDIQYSIEKISNVLSKFLSE